MPTRFLIALGAVLALVLVAGSRWHWGVSTVLGLGLCGLGALTTRRLIEAKGLAGPGSLRLRFWTLLGFMLPCLAVPLAGCAGARGAGLTPAQLGGAFLGALLQATLVLVPLTQALGSSLDPVAIEAAAVPERKAHQARVHAIESQLSPVKLYVEGLNAHKQRQYPAAAAAFKRAADFDQPAAQYSLALMLAKGQGVPKDLVASYVWAKRAQALLARARAERPRGLTPTELALDGVVGKFLTRLTQVMSPAEKRRAEASLSAGRRGAPGK